MNLKDLRAEILKDNSDPLNNADITGWINRALDDLSLIARYTQSTTYNITAGQTDYTLPGDFLEVVAINSDLPRLPLNDFTSEGYKLLSDKLKLQPAPKDTYSAEMIYIASLPHLVGDTDIPAIPTPFHDLLVLYTVAKAKFKDELDNMQRVEWREYLNRKEDYVRYINRSRSVPTPMKNVYGGWRQ